MQKRIIKPYEVAELAPGETVEMAEELTASDAYRLQVRLNRKEQKTFDPNSYLDYKREGDRLQITNVTGSPVYVSVEEANPIDEDARERTGRR